MASDTPLFNAATTQQPWKDQDWGLAEASTLRLFNPSSPIDEDRLLAAFCNQDRGPVLRKTGKPKGFQYQFIDAPLQPYVTMVGKKDGLI